MSDIYLTDCPYCKRPHFVWGGFWGGLFRFCLQAPLALILLLVTGWLTKAAVLFLIARLP